VHQTRISEHRIMVAPTYYSLLRTQLCIPSYYQMFQRHSPDIPLHNLASVICTIKIIQNIVTFVSTNMCNVKPISPAVTEKNSTDDQPSYKLIWVQCNLKIVRKLTSN
jgi:hypothetical protein